MELLEFHSSSLTMDCRIQSLCFKAKSFFTSSTWRDYFATKAPQESSPGPPKRMHRAFMVSTRMEGRIEGLEKTMNEVQEEIGSVRDYLR